MREIMAKQDAIDEAATSSIVKPDGTTIGESRQQLYKKPEQFGKDGAQMNGFLPARNFSADFNSQNRTNVETPCSNPILSPDPSRPTLNPYGINLSMESGMQQQQQSVRTETIDIINNIANRYL